MPTLSTDNIFRHLTLRQLQIFETVVRLGGVTRAAKALHLSQPTVSMQIKKLSETLGLALLEQVGRTMQPTSAGRDVYANIREILDRVMGLGDLALELKGEVKGELNIAVITTAAYFMPHFLGVFVERHPQVRPRLTITNRAEVLERLRSNKDDLLIMGQVPSELGVKSYPILDNEMVVVAPPVHPLATKKNIPLAQLTQERFLVREPGSGTRQAVERMLAEQGLEFTPYMVLGNAEAIKQGVMAGLGISVLSRRNLSLELSEKHIAILDVKGFPLIRRWYAVHLRGKKLSLTARTFLDFILNESGSIQSSKTV
ncbi:MAG: LysR family transcriptional regulator [Rhizobiaceae bacterium]|nr:LysR family transcriptional regulator [Rhizobiaceae bacterium]